MSTVWSHIISWAQDGSHPHGNLVLLFLAPTDREVSTQHRMARWARARSVVVQMAGSIFRSEEDWNLGENRRRFQRLSRSRIASRAPPTLSTRQKLETKERIATACYQARSSEANKSILSDTSLSLDEIFLPFGPGRGLSLYRHYSSCLFVYACLVAGDRRLEGVGDHPLSRYRRRHGIHVVRSEGPK
jgi:hypothetical protein